MLRKRTMNRRQFVTGGLAAAATLGAGPRFLLRSACAQTTPGRAMVCIFQRGAVDGLNMVVPHGESRYYSLRNSIALPRPGSNGGVLDLDGFFGLHPSMSALEPMFDDGELAVVHACGSPDETRSHFDAQDYMETGTPGDKTTEDGWINRHLQTIPPSQPTTLRAVAVTGNVPRALAGPESVYAAASLLNLDLGTGRQGDLARAAIDDMYRGRTDLIGQTVEETLDNYAIFTSLGGYTPANGAAYPNGALGRQLREVAQVLKSNLGVEVAFLEVGGWDTHVNEGSNNGQLANLLRTLGDAMAAFRTDMGNRMDDVCLMTMSEFGRTAAENGSGGTDHGHGTAMLALGGTVRGGKVYGDWPGLGSGDLYQGRDLDVTTDFRTFFGEVIERHLGNGDIDAVFPGFDYGGSTRLGLIA
ncbi:MAG: DUF1501 domain-containing protein [Candidatus Binatia bacterium]|nr:DUF1501 domain-containing protein [Candidatus Binatia bacterium]